MDERYKMMNAKKRVIFLSPFFLFSMFHFGTWFTKKKPENVMFRVFSQCYLGDYNAHTKMLLKSSTLFVCCPSPLDLKIP